MPRAKSGIVKHKRTKKVMKLAKGYRGRRSKLYKIAKQQVIRSLWYAYTDRKRRKRDFRRLWITRISAAVKLYGLSYSKFMNGIKKAEIMLNRKALSNLAIEDKKGFEKIVETVKNHI